MSLKQGWEEARVLLREDKCSGAAVGGKNQFMESFTLIFESAKMKFSNILRSECCQLLLFVDIG